MSHISVYINAYNEAKKVASTIKSVLWADEIVLIDCWSTDGTQEIAANLGAKIVQVKAPPKNISKVLHKANHYSSLFAQRIAQRPVSMRIASTHGLKALVKHYIFKHGFLDGGARFVSSLQSFLSTFYRCVKAVEIQQDVEWQAPK